MAGAAAVRLLSIYMTKYYTFYPTFISTQTIMNISMTRLIRKWIFIKYFVGQTKCGAKVHLRIFARPHSKFSATDRIVSHK